MDKILSTDQLIELCKSFNWTRKIKQLHVHHTYQPDHKDYNGSNGLKLQESMRSYHVHTKKWQDIGQHLTLLPDGQWVIGRDFNINPASIEGWNEGSFAIEMIGNFDTGHDKFEGKQAESMFKFCAWFCMFKVLNVDADVKFHRDNPTAGKTCPGTGIDRTRFMNTLKQHIKGEDNLSWKDILQRFTNDPDKWEKAIMELVVNADSGKCDPIVKFLPLLIEKAYAHKK